MMQTIFLRLLILAIVVVCVEGTHKETETIRNLRKLQDAPAGQEPYWDAVVQWPCFSDKAMVQVLGGASEVPLKDLQVGEQVKTANGGYTSVYAFGHYSPEEEANFLKLSTNHGGRPLVVTEEHMLFVKEDDEKDSIVKAAGDLKVGDTLIVEEGATAQISRIKTTSGKGLYAPLTVEGNLLVDGIMASSYVALFDKDEWDHLLISNFVASQQDYVHLALSPMRLTCRLASCSSVAKWFCDSYTDEGYPPYVSFGLKVHRYAGQQTLVLKGTILVSVILLAGIFRLVEYLLLDTAAGVPFLVVVVATGLIFWRIHRNKNNIHK